MSQFVELAGKLQEQQLAAVKQSQDAFLTTLELLGSVPGPGVLLNRSVFC